MLIKSESRCVPFIANDGCVIRELLHPKNDEVALGFSLAIAEVGAGARTYRHSLAQAEVYYILSGTGVVHIGEDEQAVTVGDAVLIPAGETQWIHNTDDTVLKFAAIVSPPWRREDDVRL